jgi:dehydrogenase/reductase SDR family protein 4
MTEFLNPGKCRRYEGKVCLVTASTQGIGFAIAARFASEGAKVIVSSRKQDAVDDALAAIAKLPGVQAGDIFGKVCHVDNAEHRKALLDATKQKFGTIDVFVLNAAASSFTGMTLDTPAKAYDKIMATNLRSTFLFAQDALPYLTKSGAVKPGRFSTSILMTGSITGYQPAAPIGIYGVTKTAMMGLMKALSTELAPQGIRVNLLAPGLIRTSLSAMLVDAAETSEKIETVTPCSVINRVGEPVEMAGVASFLCSADASYVTGETIVAAGGSPRL